LQLYPEHPTFFCKSPKNIFHCKVSWFVELKNPCWSFQNRNTVFSVLKLVYQGKWSVFAFNSSILLDKSILCSLEQCHQFKIKFKYFDIGTR
jgi:hypothetical protein